MTLYFQNKKLILRRKRKSWNQTMEQNGKKEKSDGESVIWTVLGDCGT